MTVANRKLMFKGEYFKFPLQIFICFLKESWPSQLLD